MTWIIVGASAGLGRALAEECASHGAQLLLVASDERDLDALARDLEVRFGKKMRTVAHDAADHAGLARAIEQSLAPSELLDGVMFPIGQSVDQDDGTLSPEQAERIAAVNFLAVSSIASRLLPRFIAQNAGSIIGFGSVAALRGRSKNVVYAAAKRALESTFESLRHKAERHGVTVAFYCLGYLDTGLAYGKKLALPKADPADVARTVWNRRASARGRHFLPRFWYPISMVLRAMPWRVWSRLEF